MSTDPYRMVAHVKEGLLPVLVIADDLDRRDRKGRPMFLCEAQRTVWTTSPLGVKSASIRKGQRVWVTKTMLSLPTEAKPRTSASKRRDRRKIKELAAHNRLAQGGLADGTDTPVPTQDAQSVAKPLGTESAPYRAAVRLERPEYARAERRHLCDGGCGTELIFTETLATATRITTCPACKARYS